MVWMEIRHGPCRFIKETGREYGIQTIVQLIVQSLSSWILSGKGTECLASLCGIPASCFVVSLQNGRFLHLFNYFGPQMGVKLRLCNFQDNELSDFNLFLQHSPSFIFFDVVFFFYVVTFLYDLLHVILILFSLSFAKNTPDRLCTCNSTHSDRNTNTAHNSSIYQVHHASTTN